MYKNKVENFVSSNLGKLHFVFMATFFKLISLYCDPNSFHNMAASAHINQKQQET